MCINCTCGKNKQELLTKAIENCEGHLYRGDGDYHGCEVSDMEIEGDDIKATIELNFSDHSFKYREVKYSKSILLQRWV